MLSDDGPVVNTATPEHEPIWIALFDSIHHVLAAEDAFRQRGVWCDLTPVPRSLSANCGMAVEFRGCDLEAARSILKHLTAPPRSLHRPSANGYTDVTASLGETP